MSIGTFVIEDILQGMQYVRYYIQHALIKCKFFVVLTLQFTIIYMVYQLAYHLWLKTKYIAVEELIFLLSDVLINIFDDYCLMNYLGFACRAVK